MSLWLGMVLTTILESDSTMNLFDPAKVVVGSLAGVDGNAFSLMGHFARLARRQGWKYDEITKVTGKCMEGSYDMLIQTLLAHMDESSED